MEGKIGDEDIPSHEFYYASPEEFTGETRYAYHVKRRQGIDGAHDSLILNNLTAGFAHQRNLAPNCWAQNNVAFVASHKIAAAPQAETANIRALQRNVN
jgi:cobyrinic acid a,c-diamide synthase